MNDREKWRERVRDIRADGHDDDMDALSGFIVFFLGPYLSVLAKINVPHVNYQHKIT